MTTLTRHTRILEFPHVRSLINARLDDLREETHGSRRDLIFDYRELRLFAPPELMVHDDRPCEHLRGEYVPSLTVALSRPHHQAASTHREQVDHNILFTTSFTARPCLSGIWGLEPIPSQARFGHARYTGNNRVGLSLDNSGSSF